MQPGEGRRRRQGHSMVWLSVGQRGRLVGCLCWHREQPEKRSPAPGETSRVVLHSPPFFCSFLDFLLSSPCYFPSPASLSQSLSLCPSSSSSLTAPSPLPVLVNLSATVLRLSAHLLSAWVGSLGPLNRGCFQSIYCQTDTCTQMRQAAPGWQAVPPQSPHS